MTIIAIIQSHDGKFSRQEQRVADFVLNNIETVPDLNQDEIAKLTGVSVATVNRFCISIGCNGFRNFKIQITKSVAATLQSLGGPTRKGSKSDRLVMKAFSALVNTLMIARNQLCEEAIEAAVEELSKANRIIFLGVGGISANISQQGADRFFRLGIPTQAVADGYLQRMVISTLQKGDLVFAISSSGQIKELLDSVTIAREYNACTICLSKTGSPLAKLCDVAIMLDLPVDRNIYNPSSSRLVFAAIIDMLAAGVANKRPEVVEKFVRRVELNFLPPK